MRQLWKFLTLGVALLILLLGMAGGFTILALNLLRLDVASAERLQMNTLAFAMLALGLALGGALAWTSFRALREHAGTSFRRPWLTALVGLWLLSLALGFLTVDLRVFGPWLFPPFYLLDIALPPLIILSWVAGQVQDKGWNVRWRDLILGISQGGIVATCVALLGELFVVVLLVLLGALLVNLNVIHIGSLDQIRNQLRSGNVETLLPLLRNPYVIVAGAAILVGVAPLLEEFAKGLTPLWLSYRRPSLAQALLWGLAGGAGFAIFEGIFNGASGLPSWGAVSLSRVAATIIHCLGGGLTGMGWWYFLAGRRWRAIGLYVTAVLTHGLWNGSAGAVALLGAQAGVGQGQGNLVAGLGVLGVLILLGLVLLSAVSALIVITLRLPVNQLYPVVPARLPEPATGFEPA